MIMHWETSKYFRLRLEGIKNMTTIVLYITSPISFNRLHFRVQWDNGSLAFV